MTTFLSETGLDQAKISLASQSVWPLLENYFEPWTWYLEEILADLEILCG